MRYLALALLPTLLATSATAEDMTFLIQKPVLQKFNFNGIEGSASFTITPPDLARPLTAEQEQLVGKYLDLENACRGGNPGPSTDKACGERDAFNLRKSGICYGLKSDHSMAEMEYHACRTSSNEYELGSESLEVTCRPGESFAISLAVFAEANAGNSAGDKAVVKIGKRELEAEYSVVSSAQADGQRSSIDLVFAPSDVTILRDLYDGGKVSFQMNSLTMTVAIGSRDKSLRNEIASTYALCK